MATLWNSVKFQQVERLNLLRQVVKRSQTCELSDKARQAAYRAAHSLNGALGIFGLMAGSDLAQAIEKVLKGDAPITAVEQNQLQRLTDELAQMLNEAIATSELTDQSTMPLLLLVVDKHLQITPTLVSQLWSQGLTVKIPLELVTLQTLLTQANGLSEQQDLSIARGAPPDVILFNFSFEEGNAQALAQLSVLVHQMPELMVLICSADGDLPIRVRASQLGSYPFLHNPAVSDVLRGIRLLRSHVSVRKVLVVDDDPQILAALRTRLEPQGFQIVTLSQPFEFWQTLQSVAPDLLLLDIEMPKFNGLELCQAVRQAPAWSGLPIVFFTAHADSQTKQAALQAGANDLIEKSSAPADLLTRLADQMKRSHLQQAIAAISDHPTYEGSACP